MKKNYTKPYVVLESFQLDAAIASSCSSEKKGSLGYGMNTCTLDDDKGTIQPDLHIFGLACPPTGVDVINNPGSDGNDGYCYHGPMYSLIFMNS